MSVKKMLAILLSAILGLVSTTAAAGTSEPAHRDTKHIRKANKQMLHPRMQEIFGTPCRVVPIARQRAGIARKQKGTQSIPLPALCGTENPMPGGL